MKETIIKIIKKYKWQLLLQTIFITINTYMLTIPPQIIGRIVDLLYNVNENKTQIIKYTYYLLGICIILLIVRLIWKHFQTSVPRGVERDLKTNLFKRFLKLKTKDIQTIKNGEIMSYFIKDTNEIRRCLNSLTSHGIRIILTFIITTTQMAKGINISLTLITMIPMLIGTYLIIKITKYIGKSFKKSQEAFTEMSEYIQESTDGIQTTKAYSYEGENLKEFIRKNRKVYQTNNTVDIFSNLLKLSIDICFGLCYAISLLYGSKLVLEGEITVGELVTFNGYIALFVSPISWIRMVIERVKRAKISYKRLEKIYNLETEKINEKELETREKLKGNIKIDNLSFNYPGSVDSVLNNINLEIKQGETIGIIGKVASGKTTLMNLLVRLYNIPNGKIQIDGKDINKIPIETLRNNICYITQENFLFSSTLKENISLFKEEYKEDDIEESTKKAIIYEEIQMMPQKIETKVGENGGELSGGQKQRVAISRAFLKNSPILIFDDTFSALDNKTSKKILENIQELAQEKTCIIISNKVSDVKNSNKIIVLDKGKIEEQGTHEELIQKQGIYNEFYKQQLKQQTNKT